MPPTGSHDDRLQSFLEQAALVALNEPAIDLETWGKLRVLALEQGLPDGTWEAELQRLVGDGVVWLDAPVETLSDVQFTSPVRSSAKPPPLPSRRGKPTPPPPPDLPAAPTPPPPPNDLAADDLAADDLAANDLVDSAEPSPAAAGQLEEIHFFDASPTAHPPVTSSGEHQTAPTPPAPPPLPNASAGSSPRSSDNSPDDPSEQPIMATSAAPQPPTPPEPPTWIGDESSSVSTPVRVAPPKPKRPPRERFESYLNKAFAAMSTPVITRKKEAKLIAEGCEKLGLAEPYAQWIIFEQAAEHGVPVLSQSQEDGRETTEEEDEQLSSRMEAFLQRVPSILAEQRGINARSRMLMEAVAQELGLTNDQFELAMTSLQTGQDKSHVDADEEQLALREAGFREYLNESFGQLPHGILTALQEAAFLEDGVLRHGLEEERARRLIREACGPNNVRYISVEQARQHVAELIDEKLAANTWIASEVRTRILSEGEQWGVSEEECAELIAAAIEVNRRQKTKSRNVSTIAMAAAFLLVVAGVGVAAWLVYTGEQGASLAAGDDEVGEGLIAATDVGGADLTESDEDSWLDRDMNLALTSARIGWEDARPHLEQIREGVALERNEAYRRLAKIAFGENVASGQRDTLVNIFGGAYAREPYEPNADAIREIVDQTLHIENPFEPGRIEEMLWSLQVASAAIANPSSPPARRDAMTRLFGDTLGVVVESDQTASQIEANATSALLRQLYRKLGKAVTLPTDQLTAAMTKLGSLARRHLEDAEYERLEVQLLVDAIRGSEPRWSSLSRQLRRRAASKDTNTILRLVELLERSSDEELRRFLAVIFAGRSDLVKVPVSVDTVADEIRSNLGVPRETTFADRWVDFELLSQEALDFDDGGDEPAQLMRQTVRHAHAALAGQALAMQDLGESLFDELIKDGAPKIETLTAGAGSAVRRRPAGAEAYNLAGARNERLEQLMRTLNVSSRIESRVRTLSLFAQTAPTIDQLSPTHSYNLAAYLASPKQMLEHQAMMEVVPTFRHWTHLKIAMADQVRNASAKDPQLNELVQSLAEERFPQTDTDAWKRAARRSLLRPVLSQSSTASAVVDDSSAVDRAGTWLKNLYADRAKLLGAPSDQAAAVENAPAAVRLVIDRLAARLAAGKTNAEIDALLESIPYRLEAYRYVADNELTRFVLLQRLAGELTVVQAVQEHPTRGEAIRERWDELKQYDRTAENLLDQLREGERTMVKIWRIINQP